MTEENKEKELEAERKKLHVMSLGSRLARAQSTVQIRTAGWGQTGSGRSKPKGMFNG